MFKTTAKTTAKTRPSTIADIVGNFNGAILRGLVRRLPQLDINPVS